MTRVSTYGNVRAMEATGAHKHRHDLGEEDHGPRYAVGTTRAIQVLLGLWIAAALALVVYAVIDGSRPLPVTSAAPRT